MGGEVIAGIVFFVVGGIWNVFYNNIYTPHRVAVENTLKQKILKECDYTGEKEFLNPKEYGDFPVIKWTLQSMLSPLITTKPDVEKEASEYMYLTEAEGNDHEDADEILEHLFDDLEVVESNTVEESVVNGVDGEKLSTTTAQAVITVAKDDTAKEDVKAVEGKNVLTAKGDVVDEGVVDEGVEDEKAPVEPEKTIGKNLEIQLVANDGIYEACHKQLDVDILGTEAYDHIQVA